MMQLPSPPAHEEWGPSSHPPEIVAWGHVVVHVPGVQAAEGIPGQAEGGGSVQVAVPFDLDAHDASLWVANRQSELSSEPILEGDVSKTVLEKPGPTPTSTAMSWKLCPAFSTILPSRNMGQKGSVLAS